MIASLFALILLAFAAFNMPGADDAFSLPAIPHTVTASVHGQRGLAGFHHLEVLPGPRSFAAAPALSGPPRSPAVSLRRH